MKRSVPFKTRVSLRSAHHPLVGSVLMEDVDELPAGHGSHRAFGEARVTCVARRETAPTVKNT